MAISVSNYHARLIGQSAGNYHVVDLLKQNLLGKINIRFVLLGQELLHFSLPFSIVWHLEISLPHIHDILLSIQKYFAFIVPQNVEHIFVNGVVAQEYFVPFPHQPLYQGRLLENSSVLTTEEIDLVLNGLHF